MEKLTGTAGVIDSRPANSCSAANSSVSSNRPASRIMGLSVTAITRSGPARVTLTSAWKGASTPTSESMEQYFGSSNVDLPGYRNFAGIRSDAADALIEKIKSVTSHAELTVTLRALDRVLRATHSWIPNWKSAGHRVAYWDMFGFPETKPEYAFPVETYWWMDEKKAKSLKKA